MCDLIVNLYNGVGYTQRYNYFFQLFSTLFRKYEKVTLEDPYSFLKSNQLRF